MDTSLQRHSPTVDQKSFFTGPSRGDADDRSDEEAPVRIHLRQAPAIHKPPVQAMGHFIPLGEYRVSMASSRESGVRPRAFSLSPAAPQPHSRPRSLSLSYAAHEGSAPLLGSAPVNVDTKHVIGRGAAGRPYTPAGEPQLPIEIDPAASPPSGNQPRQPPAPAAVAQLLAVNSPASGTLERVTLGVDRLVAMAERSATAKTLCKTLCKTFDEEVLRPLFRAKPPAGQGALAPELLTHVLDRLAAAYPQLKRCQPTAGLFDALAGALFKRLGGHRMREADSERVFSFVARLAQGPHAEHRVGLIVRTLGQMRHALGDHRMSAVQADAFAQALCQARQQWGEDSDDRFALFVKVNLGGLLGPAQGRAPRAETVVDSLVRAARRVERTADLVPMAQGLTGAVMEGVSGAPAQRAAVRHAASLWLSSLVERGEVAGLTAVSRGVAMQSRQANTQAALFGLLDAMTGLTADARPDQMDAMAAGIASCRPGAGMLRQWLEECGDHAKARGKPELAQAAQRVSEAVARKANLDLSVRGEAATAAVARPVAPAAVNALMRDLIVRAQAGATPQELAGRFTIEIAQYRAPDAAGGPRLQGAQFEAIAARLFAASGVLLGSDPAAQPLASPFAALLRALVDAAGGAAMRRPELDTLFQQAARLKAKGVMHIPAAETCVHDALFGALRQGAPERPTQAQGLEWSAQVRRFFLAARRPGDEDCKLVAAANALARHSVGLSPAALAFMSAGLVRGVTDLASHARQHTRDIVHRNVADALSQLTMAVAGQADGRSRLAFVGLGAATAFNDEQRQSAQHVLLGAIPYLDPDVREGLEGWMYGVSGRVSHQAFAEWVTTAQENAGPGRGPFSLHVELARYAEDFEQPVASPQLLGALDSTSGMSFTQAFAAAQARLTAPVAAPQVRSTAAPVQMPDPHAAASAEMRREVAQWCKHLAARSDAGAPDDEVATEFASLLTLKLLAAGEASRVTLSREQMKLVLEELLGASQSLMGTSPTHGLLSRLLDTLFSAGRGAGKRLADATQAWVLASLAQAQAQATAGTADKTALVTCVATSLTRNGMGPATRPERGAALLGALVSAAPADADKSALREWSGAVNVVLRGLGWFGHDAATPASDATRESKPNRDAFAEASRGLTVTAFASVASALVRAEVAQGQWVPLATLHGRLTAVAAEVLRAAEGVPAAQDRQARCEACIEAMRGAYLLPNGKSVTTEHPIDAVLVKARKVLEAEKVVVEAPKVLKAEMAAI